MPVYMMLTTLTDAGRKSIQEEPERLKELNKEVEFMGAKILVQYALLGQFDFVNILEAPNNEAIAKLAIRMSAKGTFQTLTLAAIDIADLIQALKQRESPW
ncbi:MAG: GYD domain-containing protein [Dehalococcoidales bacterium]|nr:GYD domain-containing protein [Dehalococcoidales bacterium]